MSNYDEMIATEGSESAFIGEEIEAKLERINDLLTDYDYTPDE